MNCSPESSVAGIACGHRSSKRRPHFSITLAYPIVLSNTRGPIGKDDERINQKSRYG